MKKVIIFLTILSMVFNNFILCMGYDDTIQVVNSEENENILTETGTTTVATATKAWWMSDDEISANATASEYIAKAGNTTGFKKIKEEFCGYVLKMSTSSAESYVILQDPNGAYFKNFTFYIYHRGMSDEDRCNISVSNTLDGPFTNVTDGITMEEVGRIENKSTRKVWKQTVAAIDAKYVKITAPVLDSVPGGTYPVLGAFSYDWTKITDLSNLPDGTNKFCGTTNPYWLADSIEEIGFLFAEHNLKPYSEPATVTVTQEDINANPNIIGNPVNAGETGFITATGKGPGQYAIVKAPEDALISRFKYYIKLKGDTPDINAGLFVSEEIDGEYTPVSVSVKNLGYVSGFPTTHFIYEIETTEEIDCRYVKIQMPTSSGTSRLGAFEYDYKINEAALVLSEVFYDYEDILNGQNRNNIESSISLFETIDVNGEQYNIEWYSDNEEVIACNGTVRQPELSTNVTITAKVYEGDSPIYSKNFDLIVSPIGSSLVFFEDFEDAEINETDGRGTINGYNNWNTTLGGEKILTDTALMMDPVDALNKVLWLYQAQTTDSATSNTRKFDEVSGGKVELRFKHMSTTPSSFFRILFAGLDMNIGSSTISCSGKLSTKFNEIKKVVWTSGEWHEYKFILDTDRDLISVYFNGEEILSDFLLPASDYRPSSVSVATRRSGYFGTNYVDDIIVRDLTPVDADAVEIESSILQLPEIISGDIDLPSSGVYGSAIAWNTSDANVIDDNGIVSLSGEDKDVILHAIVRNGDCVAERDFNIKVSSAVNEDQLIKNEETLQKIANRFSLSKMLDGQSAFNITENISVMTEYTSGDAGRLGGCNISWSSDNTEVVKNNGEVTRLRDDVRVTLTAEFSFAEDPSIKTTVNYPLIVAGEGEYTSFYDFNERQNGESVSVIDGVSLFDLSTSGIFYGLWQAPDDLMNGVIVASRNQLSESSSEVVAETELEGKIAEAGLSFYMTNLSEKIDFKINGVNIPVSIEDRAIIVNEEKIETTVTVKQWHKIAVRFNDYDKLLYVYLDGKQISDGGIGYSTEFNIPSISVSNKGSIGVWYIDDLYIKNTDVSNDEAISRVLNALEIVEDAEWNITLPVVGEYGTRISWSSNKPDVLNTDGVVFRTVGGDTTVTLTAKVIRENDYDYKEFTVLVPGLDGTETPSQEKFEEHVALIESDFITDEKPYQITKDLILFREYFEGNSAFYGGMDVNWQSDTPSVIADDGTVSRPILDKGVKITATFTSKRNPEITAQKQFDFIVLAPGDIIHYEDFESITPEMQGTTIYGFKNVWGLELRTEEQSKMDVHLERDPLDSEKSFSEANKALMFKRFSSSDFAERTVMNFSLEEKTRLQAAKSVAINFKVMFMNADARLTLGLGGHQYNLYTNQIATAFSGKFKDGYKMTTGEWHYCTLILCYDDNAIYFMLDGNNDLLDQSYYNFNVQPTYDSILFDLPRKNPAGTVYIDDISIRSLANDDAVAVLEATSRLSLPNNIESDYMLPSYGENRTVIKWTSMNPEIISDSGEIVGNGIASLKAVVKRGAATETKEFRVNVKGGNSEFVISGLNKNESIINGVTFSRTGDFTDAELIFLVYNRGKLSQIRNTQITGSTVALEPIDISEYYDCEIKAYVRKNANIVSNVYCEN